MNPTRLFVLGALARRGPMYGHQLRRGARLDRAELWSEVRPGSLYGALHRLAAEGLIEPVAVEQDGNLPARTVYAITAEGHRELRALRTEAFAATAMRPDPVDLALVMSGDLDEEILRGHLADRIAALSAQAAAIARHGDRAWPDQTVADDLVVEHARLRLEAELAWHELVLDRLGKLTMSSEHRVAHHDSTAHDSTGHDSTGHDGTGYNGPSRPSATRPAADRPAAERPAAGRQTPAPDTARLEAAAPRTARA